LFVHQPAVHFDHLTTSYQSQTMNKKSRSRKFSAKQSARLGAYFAAGVGASMAATSTSEAAIITIDVGPAGFNIGGINGGVASGDRLVVNYFPIYGAGAFEIWNAVNYFGAIYTGLATYSFSPYFAYTGGSASPQNFSGGQFIGPDSNFSSSKINTAFRVLNPDFPQYSFVSDNFGAGSYMGFRFLADESGAYNYGWLAVTWDNTTDQFQILGGAYESDLDTPIQVPGSEPIPEPGTWAAAALLAGGAAFMRWRKRRDEAQKEAA
jgi:hypothetical protein